MKSGILQLIWPPAVATLTNRRIIKQRKQKGTENLWAQIKNEAHIVAIAVDDDITLLQFATEVAQSEAKRKDTLETKASVIVQAAGIAVSIVALAPALYDKPWVLSRFWTTLVIIVYCTAILHLLIGVYYATLARRTRDFTLPSADGFVLLSHKSTKSNIKRDLIVQRIAESKWNEDALTIKNNQLSAAEDMFLRGLAFFTMTVMIVVLGTFSILEIAGLPTK